MEQKRVVKLEGDPFRGYRIDFGTGWVDVSWDFFNNFQGFMDETAETIKALETKIENQRKELASLLEKNKRLEEENAELRDINNKNFWPNGKAPVVDFPVIQYKDIPSWFDFSFTNFEYKSRRTLNLPAKITIEGVSDDREKIDAFLEHGDVFSSIFSICRMSDIKDLVDKYNALVVSNRHLELEKTSIRDSLALVRTNLEQIRKVLNKWHEATGCDNFDQARKKIEKLRNKPYCIPFGCELDQRLLKDKNKDLQDQLKKRDEMIEKLTKEVQKLKDDKKDCEVLLQYTKDKHDKLHNMIWGGPLGCLLTIGGKFHTANGYLEHKGYKCFVDAIADLEAELELLRNKEVNCAEGTYSIFIHPKHMEALKFDIKHDRYQAETRLIEECSELIQALAKRKRTYSLRVNYIGSHELTELAHVIVSAIVYCKYWDISNELLQKAVQMKYPEPYED